MLIPLHFAEDWKSAKSGASPFQTYDQYLGYFKLTHPNRWKVYHDAMLAGIDNLSSSDLKALFDYKPKNFIPVEGSLEGHDAESNVSLEESQNVPQIPPAFAPVATARAPAMSPILIDASPRGPSSPPDASSPYPVADSEDFFQDYNYSPELLKKLIPEWDVAGWRDGDKTHNAVAIAPFETYYEYLAFFERRFPEEWKAHVSKNLEGSFAGLFTPSPALSLPTARKLDGSFDALLTLSPAPNPKTSPFNNSLDISVAQFQRWHKLCAHMDPQSVFSSGNGAAETKDSIDDVFLSSNIGEDKSSDMSL
jgi:hypothetical protein